MTEQPTAIVTKAYLAQAFAEEIKALDKEWQVNLKSVGWGNIPHHHKHMLFKMMLSETDPKLFNVYVNEGNCKELAKVNTDGAYQGLEDGKVKKDKKSEKKETGRPANEVNQPE